MKILITGANGFIGRNLAEKLSKIYQTEAPAKEELNLLDEENVEKYLRRHKFDVIIHSAGVRSSVNAGSTPYDFLDGNLRMFYNLERCRDCYGRLYYFGSGAEYDMRHYMPFMKEEYFGMHVPSDPYGFSKYIMSKTCGAADNICDLRLFGVYGKYEEWDRRFISNAICRALKGMDITIQKNVYFDYLWIDDLCSIVRWLIEHKPLHRHYNVCRGSRIDLYSLAVMIRGVLGIGCDIVVSQQGWKSEYTGSNARLLEEMGNFQYTGYEESVRELCEYYKSNMGMIDADKLI